MSLETVNICDIKDCGLVAENTVGTLLYALRDDQGLYMLTKTDVDLCGKHEHEYRTSLPELKFKEIKKS